MTNKTIAPVFIPIGGASASGKTTLSKKLKAALEAGGKSCEIVALDNYFELFLRTSREYQEIKQSLQREGLITDNQTPAEQEQIINKRYVEKNNFDLYSKVNTKLLTHDLAKLNRGESVRKGVFDFSTHRYSGYKTIKPAQYVIPEGLYATKHAKTLDESFERLTVFTSTSAVKQIDARRITRDIKERPDEPDPRKRDLGKEKKSVENRLKKDVWPAFFGFPIDPITKRTNPDSIASSLLGVDIHIINDGSSDIDDGVYTILEALGLLNDRDFILSSVHHNGLILKYASDELKSELQDNREFMLAAVRQAGLPALQYASENLKNDKSLQCAAIIPFFGLAMQHPKVASSVFARATALTLQGLRMFDTHVKPLGMTFFDGVSHEIPPENQGAQYSSML